MKQLNLFGLRERLRNLRYEIVLYVSSWIERFWPSNEPDEHENP